MTLAVKRTGLLSIFVIAFVCGIKLFIFSRNSQFKFSYRGQRRTENVFKSLKLPKHEVKFNGNETANTCGSIYSLVYLKTHKTGSSTLMSILNRHAEHKFYHNKVSHIPHPFVGGYPGKFRHDFCYNGELKPFRRTAFSQYFATQTLPPPDVIAGHFRFDRDEIKKFVNPAAKYVTILRSPIRVFESSFHYYYETQMKKSRYKITCRGEPYMQILNNSGVSYPDYLKIVKSTDLDSLEWNFRTRNYQAFDLGLDPSNMDEKYILEQARILDNTFDLVLIVEHFKESLILLKDLLCMSWKDISIKKRNTGRYKKHEHTNEELATIRSLTKQDRILYDYFNKTLWRKVDEYGREKMAKDVVMLEKYMADEELHILEKSEKEKKKKKEKVSNEIEQLKEEIKVKLKIKDNMENVMVDAVNFQNPYLPPSLLDDMHRIVKYMIANKGSCRRLML